MKIKRTAEVTELHMTADQWGLFAVEDVDQVAIKLNTSFMYAVNSGKQAKEVQEGMLKIMSSLKEFGASDTEPRAELDRLLSQIFGVNFENY